MWRLLASSLLLAAFPLLAAVPAGSAPVPNFDLPVRGADGPLTTPAPLRLRTRAASEPRIPGAGTNLARSLALGARLAPGTPPSETAVTVGSPHTVNGTPMRSTNAAAVPFTMLYAPADDDHPEFRAQLAALTGGTVDYYDARNGVPSAIQLNGYTCVYTYPNSAYVNATLMGDRLADYVDGGRKVILGAFCTFTTGSALAGRIMTAPYAPVVSPSGTNHLTLSSYAGDGSSSLHAGVLTYASPYRDFLALRAGAHADGHYQDGEIATAYREDGRVVYVNGGAANGIGDWARMIANAWTGYPSSPSILYAPSAGAPIEDCAALSAATLGPANYFDARSGTPSAAILATYDWVYTFASEPFADPTLMGDRLADFVDDGGRLVLGTYAVGGAGNHLGGRITTAEYSPVTALAPHDPLDVTWLGDGGACFLFGAGSFSASNRDRLLVQGVGRADGHYEDGEIAFAFRPDGRIVYCNGIAGSIYSSGDWARVVANVVTCGIPASPAVLYAPSDADDPALREKLSSLTGGPVVYLDARIETPTLEQLQAFSCVFTWSNFAYQDPVAFGNRLAQYVDGGGRVVLGPYSTFTNGNALQGAIMGPAYAPVTSPTGAIVAAPAVYSGDGVTRFLHGVGSFQAEVHDSLALQGAGVADAHYLGGGIAIAYRPDRRVVYLNGGLMTGAGDWGAAYANAFQAPLSYGVLYGATLTGELLTLNLTTGAGTHAGSLPAGGANELVIDPGTGRCWYQLAEETWAAQEIFFRTGTGIGPAIPNGSNFAGLEFALGRLYGTANNAVCGASELRTLDPANGSSLTIGPTFVVTVTGLAFDPRTSSMLGVASSACGLSSRLQRIDLTTGTATPIGPPLSSMGSLEYGPDGDLYGGGGGTNSNSGKLYRIHPRTGVSRLVGSTGSSGISGLALAPGIVAAVLPDAGSRLHLSASPNPSPGTVRFGFSLPTPGGATLEIFDIAGRSVWRRSVNGLPAGDQALTWNGRGPDGRRVAGGVYLARLVTAAGTRSTRFVQLD